MRTILALEGACPCNVAFSWSEFGEEIAVTLLEEFLARRTDAEIAAGTQLPADSWRSA